MGTEGEDCCLESMVLPREGLGIPSVLVIFNCQLHIKSSLRGII